MPAVHVLSPEAIERGTDVTHETGLALVHHQRASVLEREDGRLALSDAGLDYGRADLVGDVDEVEGGARLRLTFDPVDAHGGRDGIRSAHQIWVGDVEVIHGFPGTTLGHPVDEGPITQELSRTPIRL
jgi:hypothetical protein